MNKPNWTNIVSGGSVVMFVTTLAVAVSMALAWLAHGLLGLAGPIAWAVTALCLVGALALGVVFAKGVHRAEPFFGASPAAGGDERSEADGKDG